MGEPTAGHTTPPQDLARQLELLKQKSVADATETPDPKFVAFYNSISPVSEESVSKIPGETFDHIFPQNIGSSPSPLPSPNPNQFLTSDSCMGCHSGGIPPYYLNARFREAPNGPATRRLYYLPSNLQTRGTPIENWKLQIATASSSIGQVALP